MVKMLKRCQTVEKLGLLFIARKPGFEIGEKTLHKRAGFSIQTNTGKVL